MATDPILRITYHSRHFGLDVCHLGDILASSRRNNNQLGITGVLMHTGDAFLQTLEGPPSAVRCIYATIRMDQRHHLSQVIGDELADERLFPAWAMGSVELDREGYGEIVRFLGRRMSNLDELLLRFSTGTQVA